MWSEQHPKRFNLVFDTLFKLFAGDTIMNVHAEHWLLDRREIVWIERKRNLVRIGLRNIKRGGSLNRILLEIRLTYCR